MNPSLKTSRHKTRSHSGLNFLTSHKQTASVTSQKVGPMIPAINQVIPKV